MDGDLHEAERVGLGELGVWGWGGWGSQGVGEMLEGLGVKEGASTIWGPFQESPERVHCSFW